MKRIAKMLPGWAWAVALTATSMLPAAAQNPNYAPGDVVLTFQNPGGPVGADKTVMFAMESSQFFRGAIGSPTTTNLGNIETELVSAFGADWFDEPTLWMGAVGNVGTTIGDSLTNGDPRRTVYSSKPRLVAGTPGVTTNTSLVSPSNATGVASAINASNNKLEILSINAAAVIPVFDPMNSSNNSLIPSYNPFVVPGQQGTAYTAIQGGVQTSFSATDLGTFGSVGVIQAALDLFRHQPRNDIDGQFGQGWPTGAGEFLGTIAINDDGDVFFVPAANPSTAPLVQATNRTSNAGAPFSYQIVATNQPSSFNATGLPAWASVNTTTGKITGTPGASDAGSTIVTLFATNGAGPSTGTEVTFTIIPPPPVITSGGTIDIELGDEINYQIVATNTPTSYGLTGTLPNGVVFDDVNGTLTGTPTESGSFPVALTATNAGGTSVPLSLTITITLGLPFIQNFGPFEGFNNFGLDLEATGNFGTVLSIEWLFNGRVIRGANQATFTIPRLSARNVGLYTIRVTNTVGTSEATAPLSLLPAASFDVVSGSQFDVPAGNNVTFEVDNVTGSPLDTTTPTFQWLLNGRPIRGANSQNFTVTGVSPANAGLYQLRVNNGAGFVISEPFVLTVEDTGILVYNIGGTAIETNGPRESAARLANSFFLIDRANGNAAVIFSGGVPRAGTGFNVFELREDVAAQSTGPIPGSRSTFVGSVFNGNNPDQDHDIILVSGLDALQTLFRGNLRAVPPQPAILAVAPRSLVGTFGSIDATPNNVGASLVSPATLTLNVPDSTAAYQNNETLQQAVDRIRGRLNAAGFLSQP